MLLSGVNQKGETTSLYVDRSVFSNLTNGINIAQRVLQEKEGRSFVTPVKGFGTSLEVFDGSYRACVHLRGTQEMSYKFSFSVEMAEELVQSLASCLDKDALEMHLGKKQ